MRRKLNKLVPVGVKVNPVLVLSAVGFVLCAFSALSDFYRKLFSSLNEISRIDDSGVRVFLKYARMDPFEAINSNFYYFRIFFVCLILFAAYCFLHHFMGSKSIYTMKRLKSPSELYVRCLSVPVIFIALSFAAIYLMNYIFVNIYLDVVPEECLLPWWDKNIWRDLL